MSQPAHLKFLPSIKYHWPAFAVTGLFVGLLLLWSSFDHALPDWDAAGHILNGWQYKELLRRPKFWNLHWCQQFLSVNQFYPPFVYITSGLFKLVLGTASWVELVTRSFYVIVLCLSVYGTAFLLTRDRWLSSLSVVLINFYPMVANYSHTSMLDFPLMAMVALGLFTLFCWQRKPSWGNSVILAFALAFACLTKQIAACFLVLPCLVVFVGCLYRRQFKEAGLLAASGIGTALIGLPWLLVNASGIASLAAYNQKVLNAAASTATNATGAAAGAVATTSKAGSMLVNGLYYAMVSPVVLTPLLLGLFLLSVVFAKPSRHKQLGVLLASCFGGITLVSTIAWAIPLERYLLPGLIGPAIYSSSLLIDLWQSSKLKIPTVNLAHGLVLALMLVFSVQFFAYNFSPYPISGPGWLVGLPRVLQFGAKDIRVSVVPGNPLPDVNWGQDWAVSQIELVDHKNPVWLNVLPSTQEINVHTLEYVAKLRKSTVMPTTSRTWTTLGDMVEFSPEKTMWYQWYLLKTGDQGNSFHQGEAQANFAKLTDYVAKSGKFHLVQEMTLPDKSQLLLYRQN